MMPFFITSSPNYKKLTPTEKIILLTLYMSPENRFCLAEISSLTNIHRSNVYKYVKRLSEYDFLDMCLFGRTVEVLKK